MCNEQVGCGGCGGLRSGERVLVRRPYIPLRETSRASLPVPLTGGRASADKETTTADRRSELSLGPSLRVSHGQNKESPREISETFSDHQYQHPPKNWADFVGSRRATREKQRRDARTSGCDASVSSVSDQRQTCQEKSYSWSSEHCTLLNGPSSSSIYYLVRQGVASHPSLFSFLH